MAVLAFPIRVRDRKSIRIGAAGTTAALQAVEPSFEWRIGVSPVVTGRRVADRHGRENDRAQTLAKPHIAHVTHQERACLGEINACAYREFLLCARPVTVT